MSWIAIFISLIIGYLIGLVVGWTLYSRLLRSIDKEWEKLSDLREINKKYGH